jgi:regulatory protein
VRPADPYLAALKLLAGRELSETQVRQRLSRRGYDADDVEQAVERLKAERAIDDHRVAAALVHAETVTRRRGRHRVLQRLVRAGIAAETAREAVDHRFRDDDEDTVLQAALARRLPGSRSIEGTAEFSRLYRYLIGQGFDADRVVQALRRRRSPSFPRGDT